MGYVIDCFALHFNGLENIYDLFDIIQISKDVNDCDKDTVSRRCALLWSTTLGTMSSTTEQIPD